ncbi:MAG: UDP-N-acetylglucosamine 2-epimerase (non-hydrolyzing) [Actinobacteria bacterium]|nr:UDP-N-acetylglucosamine 2-epimerase (non-hydrolyzing) [Actinomycetota bacterium]
MLVYGTRPEAIKMAPVVKELGRHPALRPIVVVTGQHREMLDQVNRVFGIVPDHDLNIITPGQSLTEITVRSLSGLEPLITAERPDLVVVQGDTTTCFAASMAAFYQQVPVAHVEAGLRTDNRYNPFPEEINRRLTSQVASLHLAPTTIARENLLASGVDRASIVVTGNTVIDALFEVTASEHPISDPTLAELAAGRVSPLLLVTTHRRESWGEPLRRTAAAIAQLVRDFPELHVLLPAHRNPVVRDALLPTLGGLARVHITEPLDYPDFCRALELATIVLTDSGGVQEEAPALGKPVLVLRETTERPEAVHAGAARLVGTDTQTIVAETTRLLTDADHVESMRQAGSPYGDGRAAERSVQAMAHLLGVGDAPAEYRP